jgi:molybdate/tungstate transport system substrate-binding protein
MYVTRLMRNRLPVLLILTAACAQPRPAREITVFNAGALAKPLRVALDSFARRNGVTVRQESAGSLETARKITELGRVPDVVALADTAIFSRMLAGRTAAPVTPVGRSRMVLAFTPRSRFADAVSSANWTDVVRRPGVEVGRSDPSLDPAGYRALLVWQLAERYYGTPGLARALAAASPPRNVRPKSADLVALLQTGNLDYAWEYESAARNAGLRFVRLPAEIDLGDPALGDTYAQASVEIPAGSSHGSAQPIHGAPIVFGIAPLRAAPHGDVGVRFITYLMSSEGRRILADANFLPVTSVDVNSAPGAR